MCQKRLASKEMVAYIKVLGGSESCFLIPKFPLISTLARVALGIPVSLRAGTQQTAVSRDGEAGDWLKWPVTGECRELGNCTASKPVGPH